MQATLGTPTTSETLTAAARLSATLGKQATAGMPTIAQTIATKKKKKKKKNILFYSILFYSFGTPSAAITSATAGSTVAATDAEMLANTAGM
jgi:hypothetical protein